MKPTNMKQKYNTVTQQFASDLNSGTSSSRLQLHTDTIEVNLTCVLFEININFESRLAPGAGTMMTTSLSWTMCR